MPNDTDFTDEELAKIKISKFVNRKIEQSLQSILANYNDLMSDIAAPRIEELKITIKTEIKRNPFIESVCDNKREILCWIIDEKIILRDPKSLKDE